MSKVLCELENLANDQLDVHDHHKESVYKIKTNEKLILRNVKTRILVNRRVGLEIH